MGKSLDSAEVKRRVKVGQRTEHQFLHYCKTRGLLAFKPGWPDFIIQNQQGQVVCAVEVKKDFEYLRANQRRCATLLQSIGLPVFTWCPSGIRLSEERKKRGPKKAVDKSKST